MGACADRAFAQTANAGATAVNEVQAVAGNSQATNAGNTQSIIQQGTQQLPHAPGVVIPGASAPSLFQFLPNQAGYPAEMASFQLDAAYLTLCKPRGGKGKLPVESGLGESKKTSYVFTGHQNLIREGNVMPEIEVDLSGTGTFRCLGNVVMSVTIDTARKGEPISMTAIVGDLMNSLDEHLRGFKGNVVLLSHPTFWAGGLGVAGQGKGWSFGLGLFNAVSPLTGATVAPGYSSTNGASVPVTRVGMGFIIAERVTEGSEGAVRIALAPPPAMQGEPQGGNGRKAEAEKR